MKRSPVLTAFGFNVRKRREARQLTQEALAEKSGLHPTYISGIERGVRNPSPTCKALLRFLPSVSSANSAAFLWQRWR